MPHGPKKIKELEELFAKLADAKAAEEVAKNRVKDIQADITDVAKKKKVTTYQAGGYKMVADSTTNYKISRLPTK